MKKDNKYINALDELLDTRSLTDGMPLLNRISFDYKYHFCTLIEQAIYLKYPNIKALEVLVDEDDFNLISIYFEDDGIHTKEMIEKYLEQFKKESTNFKP